jgi:RNA polymerase sigma-70 factor (ECF subfamily)
MDVDAAASGDRSLMERIHASDRSALDELLRKHWAPLVAYAERLLPNRDDAEDVVQETMLRVWRNRAHWTPTERLRSLLFRITRNLAINERRRGRVRERYRDDAANRAAAPRVDTPLHLLEREELRAAVAHALEAVPPRRREVFVLAWYHGHSYREIAEIMDISPQTVANQMSAALEDLRRLLRPQIALMMHGQPRLVREDDGLSLH